MPSILAVETAVPIHAVKQAQVRALVRSLFGSAYPDIDRLLKIFDHTGIDERHFAMPLAWFEEPHDFGERNRVYVEQAISLCAQAGMRCLEAADVPPSRVDAIIFVSTTGLATPSLDARILSELGLRGNVHRTPIWGLGCAGGAIGLSRAYQYALAYPRALVLLVAVELCSLTFQDSDRSKSTLVATSLFADGAAAVLVAGDQARHAGPLRILDCQSTLWPNTLNVMGWDVSPEGLRVVMSQEIPDIVRRWVRANTDAFLSAHDLRIDAITSFVVHPGGPKVLTAYRDALGVPEGAFRFSKAVMRANGNMSSPTVLFVLRETMRAHPAAGYGLLSALGPGFSSEQVLLRWEG